MYVISIPEWAEILKSSITSNFSLQLFNWHKEVTVQINVHIEELNIAVL